MYGDVIFRLDQAGNAVLPFLLRQTLLSSILFVIVLILVRILRKSTPLFHLGLYALVLVRLVLPPDFSLPFSGRSVLDAAGLSGLFSIGVSATPAAGTETADSGYSLGEESGGTVPFPGELRTFPWAAAVFAVWMTGVLVLSVVVCRRLIAFRRITRRAVSLTGGGIADAVERWKRIHRIRRPVRIVTSDLCLSPFTIGIRRPVIHIPSAALKRDNPDLIESIIGHELAHVKTLDAFWIRVQNVLQVVYFFNPALWASVSRMHLLRECLADDMVIAGRRLSPETYGLGLLAVLKWNVFGAESLGLLPEFGSSRRKIMKRIENIKSGRPSIIGGKGVTIAAAGTLLLGLFLLPMAGAGRGTVTRAVLQGSDGSVLVSSGAFTPDETPVVREAARYGSPLPGKTVTAGFGPMRDPYTGKEMDHSGVDIKASRGSAVRAIEDGKAVKAVTEYQADQGKGRFVLLAHADGMSSLYSHLDSVLVSEGQTVKRGDVIGTVGSTGRSTGPHLHLEIRKGDAAIDPASVIDFRKGELKEVKEKKK